MVSNQFLCILPFFNHKEHKDSTQRSQRKESCDGLRVTGYGLRVTGDRLRVTGNRLRVTGDRLRVTGDM